MPAKNDLTPEYLRSILDYDPTTGIFRWRWRADASNNTNKRFAGKAAGHLNSRGYLQIRVDGRRYQAHRLAWVITHGAWPDDQIDHINGVRTDNRLINLRVVSNAVNAKNAKRSSNNASGVMGVKWHKASNKWVAYFRHDGKHIHIGLYPTKAEAAFARIAIADLYGFHPNHGRDARQA